MFGLVIEIGVAISSAIDAWETRQIAIKNDPHKLPVFDISADAIIFFNGTNLIAKQNQNLYGTVGIGLTNESRWGSPSQIADSLFLTCSDQNIVICPPTWGSQCNMHFEAPPIVRYMIPIYFRGKTAAHAVQDIYFITVRPFFLPINTRNLSGLVTIHINGVFEKTFKIPNTTFAKPIGSDGVVPQLIVTNFEN